LGLLHCRTIKTVRVTPRLKQAEVLDDCVVRLAYADGLTADVDLGYVVEMGPVFEELRRPENFRRLRVSRAANTISWPNGADIAPESLYELARRAAALSP
jgi:hypothetical protein